MPKIKIEKSILKELYWKKGLSIHEIAKKLGVSITPILNRMREFGIPRRSTQEGIKNSYTTHPERREERSKRMMGKNNPFYGKHHTEETIKSLRLSLSKRWYGEDNPFYGKNHKEETKSLLSSIQIELWKNPDYRRRASVSMSIAQIERWSDKEERKKLSKTMIVRGINVGEKNPQWRGGISFEPYGPEFNKRLKTKIKERDNYTCQLCEATKNLRVHHTDYDKKNNNPENLITLCNACNLRVNHNRGFWEDYFNERLFLLHGRLVES